MSVAAAIIPPVVFGLGALVWLYRLQGLRRVRVTGAAPRQAVDVSIIVPARNEAHNLPALLASLAALDPPPREVIVVDDHSTDGTGELAAAAGARVVRPPELPPGWLGKPWACHAGARAASGAYLLFTDADTVHAPDSLAVAVGRIETRGAALLSVVPTHLARRFWERLQGVFQLLLLVACRAGGRPRRGTERRFSIGQYLLFRREAYDRLGGHPAVRDRVAEDLAFARMVEASGEQFELVHRPGMMSVRMYPEGLGGFVRGWRRNFREGMAAAGALGVVEIALVIGWLLGVPLALGGALVAGDLPAAAAWASAYLLTSAEIARRQAELGELPGWAAPLYPTFALIFIAVSVLATFDRMRRAPVRWKNRSVTT